MQHSALSWVINGWWHQCGFRLFWFACNQRSASQYGVYSRQTIIDDSLSLNLNQCHHPLITQLTALQKWGHTNMCVECLTFFAKGFHFLKECKLSTCRLVSSTQWQEKVMKQIQLLLYLTVLQLQDILQFANGRKIKHSLSL